MEMYHAIAITRDGEKYEWESYFADSPDDVIEQLMGKGWAQEGDIISVMKKTYKLFGKD